MIRARILPLSLLAALFVAAPAAAQGSSDAPESDVSYSCNEGIPLTVRYRNEGPDFVAYVSHDSFPEVRLVQVPSGSGLQFQSGPNWMGSDGSEVSIEFGGISDTCREVN